MAQDTQELNARNYPLQTKASRFITRGSYYYLDGFNVAGVLQHRVARYGFFKAIAQ